MQRRAAAVYLAFFVVAGAAAYGLMATAAAPGISLDGETYSEGDNVTFGEQTYTVSSIEESGGGGGGHGGGGETSVEGELTWTNESAQLSESLENGSTVSPLDVQWEGQQARQEATLSDGETVAYNGSEYSASVDNGTLTLTNVDDEADNESYEAGDTITVDDTEVTITEVGEDAATLVWGSEYMVVVENATDPTAADLVQQRNVTQLAADDPALYNETVRQDGVLKVTYRANDTNVPVDEYFGEIERHTIEENGTLVYQNQETTVAEVTNESVELTWTGEETRSEDLTEGGNVTLGGTEYFAHFPDNSSVQILETGEHYDEYHEQRQEIRSYEERRNGLWGVLELSALAAIILLATAFLPVKG